MKNTDNQIIRIPYKYSELFDTMDDCECGKLCKALFKKDSKNLFGLSKTYYNIIIVDILNIENQVLRGQKGGKLGGRPRKNEVENPRGYEKKNPPFSILKTQDKISKDKVKKDKVIEVKKQISFQEIFHKEIFENLEYIEKLKSKFSDEILKTERLKFISYWTESNGKGSKERFQKEKTFDIARRFTMWLSNAEKFSGKGKSNFSEKRKIAVCPY